MTDLFARVPGQERVVAQLRASLANPVHAYLFVGPAGTGKREAALAFAAGLLCPDGGDGTCRSCRHALDNRHVDLVVVERVGPFITVDQAHEITRAASSTPTESKRKVLVLVDFHLAEKAVPALLKTIEEPPPTTVFIVLAEHVPPELVTIASRCVRVDFPPLDLDTITGLLVAEGITREVAAVAARASSGRIDRARLLATDPEVAARRAAWEQVPARLDGTGATAHVVASELLEMVNRAGSDGMAARHAAEVAAQEERAALSGEKVTGRKETEDRHKREQRRMRTDELRFGLAVLAGAYRDRAAAATSPRSVRACVEAGAAIQDAGEALIRNPNEMLLVQALLVRLQPLSH